MKDLMNNYLLKPELFTACQKYSWENLDSHRAEKRPKLTLQSPVTSENSFEIRFTSKEIILIILLMIFSLEWIIRRNYSHLREGI